MTGRVIVEGLSVARVLYDFINREVLPGTGVPEAALWTRLDRIVHDLAPRNRALLAKREYETQVVRREVTSPGGATARGLAALERAGVRAAFHDAMDAVLGRSRG